MVISKTRLVTKGVSIGAAALLAMQVFAGVSVAALPPGGATDVATPDAFSAGNDAGFTSTFVPTGSSTLSKLFGEVFLTNATTTTFISASIDGKAVAGACNAVGSVPVQCQFRNVRPNSVVVITVGATPSSFAAGSTVAAVSQWTTSGFGSGAGDNSHGDTWNGNGATATFTDSQDIGAGFGETTIQNFQVVDKINNTQAAKLTNLPGGIPASIDDTPTNTSPCTSNTTVKCDKLVGYWVIVNVAGGATFTNEFQIVLKYYVSGSPSYFVHVYTDANGQQQQETILACGKKTINPPCFEWNNSTNTATIHTFHNGAVKRG